MGVIPTALSQLTSRVTNGQGQVAGPFCAFAMPCFNPIDRFPESEVLK